ncbi:MAG: hypothetical protein KDA92_18575, partial [Planctomycetales bacterium]|nr:hypothetical protein [Planctomycetales bacterium]
MIGLLFANLLPGLQTLAAAQTRTVIDLMRRHELTEWWHWWLLALACAAVVAYVSWLYRKDSLGLPRGVRLLLLSLRLVAFTGLLLFFFDLEKRTERQVTRASRVAVLVDTSQSMGLTDHRAGNDSTRLNRVIEEFSQGRLLHDLQQKHDVLVYRFDQTAAPQPVATFAKLASDDVSHEQVDVDGQSIQASRYLLFGAATLGGLALLSLLLHQLSATLWRGTEGESYLLLTGMVT